MQADSDTAMVFLYLLVIQAIMVGVSVGVLLPKPLAGICWGCTITLLVGAFLAEMVKFPLYFPIAGGVLSLLAAAAAFR